MRVQLKCRRDERGGVAVMSAALVVVFALLAGFTVDFGMAYSKRQELQVASDAGSLAAAQVFKGRTEPCATLRDNTAPAYAALRSQAQAAADEWASKNSPGLTGSLINITCNGDALRVTYRVYGESSTAFGGLAGIDGPISLGRKSVATIGEAPYAVGNMRPWGICSGVVSDAALGQVIFVPTRHGSTSLKDTSETLCGDQGPPGGWWVAQCVGQGNANGQTESIVTTGCAASTSYAAVPNQASRTTPLSLYEYLTNYCPSGSSGANCLSSDQGNNFHNASDEWQPLVGQTFTMPVFCVRPTCSSMAVAGSGNNAAYAIHRLATVVLCGFEFQPRSPSENWPATGPCATSNVKGYTSGDVVSGGGFFLVIKSLSGGPVATVSAHEYNAARLTE